MTLPHLCMLSSLYHWANAKCSLDETRDTWMCSSLPASKILPYSFFSCLLVNSTTLWNPHVNLTHTQKEIKGKREHGNESEIVKKEGVLDLSCHQGVTSLFHRASRMAGHTDSATHLFPPLPTSNSETTMTDTLPFIILLLTIYTSETRNNNPNKRC